MNRKILITLKNLDCIHAKAPRGQWHSVGVYSFTDRQLKIFSRWRRT